LRIKILSGNANKSFAQLVCKHLNLELSDCEIIKFSNENIKVNIKESVRGQDVYIIQTSCPPVSDGIVELLIMIDAVKHASAARITAVCPYFPYVRSDKKDQPRISITARLMADLLQTAGANRVMTMNLHSAQIQGFFRIPCDHLLAGKILCDYVKKDFNANGQTNYVVVAPDAGSAKLSAYYTQKLNLPLAILDKRRIDDSENPIMNNVIGEVKNKNAIIFDDEVASGSSIMKAADALIQCGAKKIEVCCVHGVLSGNAIQKIMNSQISRIIVTDTVKISDEKKCNKLEIVSVTELFAKTILYTNQGKSISSLYNIF
jgi:ribose-phosphate pyrophosphokinase